MNEQKKYNIKEYVSYNSIYMKFMNRPKKLNVKVLKQAGSGVEHIDWKGHMGAFGC